LKSKGFVVDPSDTKIYSVVQGDRQNDQQALPKKNQRIPQKVNA
jgi:hypothetical protein